MRHLFIFWKEIKKVIKGKKKILLLLDYDGTLTPIVSRPSDAILGSQMRKSLVHLSRAEKFDIGIVSGRRLSEVRGLVKVKGIYYAGNHGLEIKGPNIQFLHPNYIRFKPYIKKIKQELKNKLGDIRGILIEDKDITLSLHYRLVNQKDIRKIKNVFKKLTLPYLRNKKIKITEGKKVLEVRPPINWDKGKALGLIERLTKKTPSSLTIYIGDDQTDEDAFRVLKKKGISIFVGKPKRKSHARYYLKDTGEVIQLFRLLFMQENSLIV